MLATPSFIPSTQSTLSIVAQPTSTKTIFESEEQLSDGVLKLSIKKPDNQCYKPGVPIPLTLTYENLADEVITIADYNAMSVHVISGGDGQLFPVITENTDKEVLTPQHYQKVEIINTSSPLLQDLPPKSSFDVSIDFYFPSKIIELDKQDQKITHPTPPGLYFLKFVYMGFEKDMAWEGAISSNQVAICIAE
jgi:hypothetical protein